MAESATAVDTMKDKAPGPVNHPSGWRESEARDRLGLRDDNTERSKAILEHDAMVADTRYAIDGLSTLDALTLVMLYQNRRTRYLVNARAEKLDLNPDGVHAVLAELPTLNGSQ